MFDDLLDAVCDWAQSESVEELLLAESGMSVDLSEHLPTLAEEIWIQTEEATPGGFAKAIDWLMRTPPDIYINYVDRLVGRKLGDAGSTAAAARQFLRQMPSQIRSSLKRPSDTSGRTIPDYFTLRRPDDLLKFFPPRLSRFQPGQRPLKGVDLELVELLGVGGVGEVWKAKNPHLENAKAVALKFCLDPQAARLLRHEAALLDRVVRNGTHPGIVQLRNTYLSADPPCLEYQLVSGGDLTGLIEEWHRGGCGPSVPQATRVIYRLAEIVAFAHSQDPPIVHRDLKPSNILIERSAEKRLRLLVADFGIGGLAAKNRSPISRRGGKKSALLTSQLRGSFTPLYASPQQLQGNCPDPRDDVFALGVIWFQLMTGGLRVGAPSGSRWMKQLTGRGMSNEQIDVLSKCLEPDADDRIASAVDLVEQLDELQRLARRNGEPSSLPPKTSLPNSPLPRRERPDETTHGDRRKRKNDLRDGTRLPRSCRPDRFDQHYHRMLMVGIPVAVFVTLGDLIPGVNFLAQFSAIIAFIVLQNFLLFHSWTLIQDGVVQTTPGKAVGLRFIPFFLYYWNFVAVGGLAQDLNKYAEDREIPSNPVSIGLANWFCIMDIIAGTLGYVPILGSLLFIAYLVITLVLFNQLKESCMSIAEWKMGSEDAAIRRA